MIESIKFFLAEKIQCSHEDTVIGLIVLTGIAVSAVIFYYIAKLLLTFLEKAVLRSENSWDNDLVNSSLLRAVSQLAPAVLIAVVLPEFFAREVVVTRWIHVLTGFYIIWTAVRVVIIGLNNLYAAIAKREHLKFYAVKGIFQMLKLIVIGIGIIIGLSILINKTPIAILTALGASAAILMLVFKDTILGLVASVQLTANNMLHRGDWIEAPKHGANGVVEDVSLTTVKVRNWDNTVTTIPPYSLVAESFNNYNPMLNSGGRRVSRAIYLDINSINFCSKDKLEQLSKNGFLDGLNIDENSRIVNLSLFRDYLERYLDTIPGVNRTMTHMVRQLDPTPSGVPLQLYFFTATTTWIDYEHIQTDIFAHIYAVINNFGLKIFQTPTGLDIHKI